MERETDREIINLRSDLHQLYARWNHSKKTGVEHLPREPKPEDIQKIKERIDQESQSLALLKICCESLIDKLNQENVKL